MTLAFLEAVIRAVEEQAVVAKELGRRDFWQLRVQAVEVVAAIAPITQNDPFWIVVKGANLANLVVAIVSASTSTFPRIQITSPGKSSLNASSR